MKNTELQVNGSTEQKSESVIKKIRKNAKNKAPQETNAALPAKEANGSTRETNGAFIPFSGPITSARQLINRGKNINAKSVGYHETLSSYTDYLKSLTMSELQRHAIEEANISAVDDRARLIRRLENEWSGTKHKESFGGATTHVPKSPAPTPEQIAAHKDLLKRTGRA